MRRFLSFVMMVAMTLSLVPAAGAIEGEPVANTDLDVTWYSDWDVLSRLYGTNRMILVKDNLCALYGLDGTKYTDPVFDAIGEYDAQDHAVAMRYGKWGKIDLNGNTVVDFIYDSQGDLTAGNAALQASEIPENDEFREGLRWVNAEGSFSSKGLIGDGPWGFQNEAGELVVPYIYDTVGHFDHGYASVTVDGYYGLLRNPLLEPEEPKVPEGSANLTFIDVPAGSWFEKGVMTCAQNGIMVGTGENTFSPDATLTDAECAMLAYRLYDQANGGDGSVLKMPEGYGYIKLVSDDGSFVHEGYAGDGAAWWPQNVFYRSDGYRLSPVGAESVKMGAATATFGGKEYRGEVKDGYRGSGRYELDHFPYFEPEDPTFNDLIMKAYRIPSPECWWADMVYTVWQKGWEDVFPYSIWNREANRGDFADILGSVTDLPKRFDVPPIPDGRERGWNDMFDHALDLYEAGIIGGVDAYGTFAFDKTLTRAEAAVMVARVLDESQRLVAPPKAMPTEGEGYTLTYLMDGEVEIGHEQDTYPYYFVEDPALEWPQRHKGLLKLDGSFLPWPESEAFFTFDWYGGDVFLWINIYENEDGSQHYVEGVLNDEMEWVIEPQYNYIWLREGGYIAYTEDGRYLLLDEEGNVEREVDMEEPKNPGYGKQWIGWENWGGLWVDDRFIHQGEQLYYRWSDGTPATEWFDRGGRIGPDGKGFVEKDGKIYLIEFTQR